MYMVQVDHRVACKVDGTHIHVGYLYLRSKNRQSIHLICKSNAVLLQMFFDST